MRDGWACGRWVVAKGKKSDGFKKSKKGWSRTRDSTFFFLQARGQPDFFFFLMRSKNFFVGKFRCSTLEPFSKKKKRFTHSPISPHPHPQFFFNDGKNTMRQCTALPQRYLGVLCRVPVCGRPCKHAARVGTMDAPRQSADDEARI